MIRVSKAAKIFLSIKLTLKFSEYHLGELLFTHMNMKAVFIHVTLVGVAHVIADFGPNSTNLKSLQYPLVPSLQV